MTSVAVDTWAFIEVFLNGPRKAEVEALLRGAESLITSREIVAETSNFIVGRTHRVAEAADWLTSLKASRTFVYDAGRDAVETFFLRLPRSSTLSYADASLALVARQQRVVDVATSDQGFRSVSLTPLFR